MASGDQSLGSSADEENFRRILFRIDLHLGGQEVESLKFLCLDLVSKKKLEKCSSALDIFELLLTYKLLQEEDPFVLAELLYVTKQIRLLQHLRYTKEEVERLLPKRRKVPLFRKMLYELAEAIDTDTLKSMTFLLRDSMPRTEMEGNVYRMDRKHRGRCIIVNNEIFTTYLSDRRGTQRDAEYLKHVFQWLGFKVHRCDNKTKEDLEALLQEEKHHPDHDDGDCFVFCVLTHGIFGAVYSSDGVLIPIREIVSHFTAQQCPGLAGKPKLFFIQACQGKEIQSSVPIEEDAVNPERVPPSLQDSIPVEADFLLGLATVPGYASLRHVENGSWYIQSLCNHLKALVPRHEDILSILTAVNHDVSRQADKSGRMRQMPQPAFTLRKRLVFPVPQGEPSF
ncbi:caspase-10 isoform X2 [Lepus europaeus]|uniref:caspase-10 isoform X2 n=1 Tax=Lepus europaeus TaxID=9983 RepID=UPI002B473CA5|nr:caspase-10 isoform X2 [Lepus europaeus]